MSGRRINFGIALILVGFYILLYRLGMTPVSLSEIIAANWPLLLIAMGVHFLFSHSRFLWFIPTIVFVLIFVFIVGPFSAPITGWAEPTVQQAFDYTLSPDVDHVHVSLRAKGTSTAFKLHSDDDTTISGNVAYHGESPVTESAIEDNTQHISLHTGPPIAFSRSLQTSWDMLVPTQYPLSIKAEAAVARLQLDLRNFIVTDVATSTNVGSTEIIFGHVMRGVTPVTIDGQVMDIKLSVPEQVGLRIEHTGFITNSDFRGQGLVYDDKQYVTEGYDQADRKLDVRIRTAVSRIHVIRR